MKILSQHMIGRETGSAMPMRERHVFVFLCAVIGFLVGLLISVKVLKVKGWVDAKFYLGLFATAGWLIGHFLVRKHSQSRLTAIEQMVLGCIRSNLTGDLASLFDLQVQTINKIQRLPGGVEVNFYRLKKGRPSFPDELSFVNKAEELHIATVRIALPSSQRQLTAEVWCVNGFLFSIEYEGDVNNFEEAVGEEPRPDLKVSCELKADLGLPFAAAV